MNYIGSKRKLSKYLIHDILQVIGSMEGKVFAEIFGGTGVMARKFKTQAKKLIVNDLEPYSYVLLRNYIGNCQNFSFFDLIQDLNFTPGEEGFIFQHYCMGGGQDRQYFSDKNGQRIDGVRKKIKHWFEEGEIDEDQYFFLLASLLESADKVANTASVYGAFLKDLKRTARKALHIEPALFSVQEKSHEVYNQDANQLIEHIEGDVLYLDPPYNARQYGANYHLLNTIALYDEFEPRGKTGLREYNKSDYCRRRKVKESLDDLIKKAQFNFIFISYNNEGLLSLEELKEILSQYGHYDLVSREYQRFKADKSANRQHKAVSTFEYLHILEKSG